MTTTHDLEAAGRWAQYRPSNGAHTTDARRVRIAPGDVGLWLVHAVERWADLHRVAGPVGRYLVREVGPRDTRSGFTERQYLVVSEADAAGPEPLPAETIHSELERSDDPRGLIDAADVGQLREWLAWRSVDGRECRWTFATRERLGRLERFAAIEALILAWADGRRWSELASVSGRSTRELPAELRDALLAAGVHADDVVPGVVARRLEARAQAMRQEQEQEQRRHRAAESQAQRERAAEADGAWRTVG